jgi:uncharacterized protein
LAEHDLQKVLGNLSVQRRPGSFCFVNSKDVPVGTFVHATVVEAEGTTAVIERGSLAPGSVVPEFVAAWLTVQSLTSLDTVGLTAVISGALADAGISCNVLAGLNHDHLLVPENESQRATEVLEGLRGTRSKR